MHESAKNRAMRPTRVAIPRKMILAFLDAVCNTAVAKDFEYCDHPRKIRLVCSHAQPVAASPHGDFIPELGRAYRMSAEHRPRQAFPPPAGTSAGVIRPQGFRRRTARPTQNTAPHGARFLQMEGRTRFSCAFGRAQGDTVVIPSGPAPSEDRKAKASTGIPLGRTIGLQRFI